MVTHGSDGVVDGGVRGRRIDRYLVEYDKHHVDPINKAIHYIAIPLICWSIFCALASLPYPASWQLWPGFGWATAAALLATVYYFTFSSTIGLGVAIHLVAYLVIIALLEHFASTPLWLIAIAIFGLAWVAQFVGHKIEGKKPKFFDDLRFLLIGPVWVLAAIFRLLGIKY